MDNLSPSKRVAAKRGKYRINAVAEMTGVPAATLRAWERRYGLPEPRRTSSSYRVYSDGDVALIRRVRELCDEGLAPSEAAKVVLAEIDATRSPAAESGSDPFANTVATIVDAVDAFAPGRLQRAVRGATTLGPATEVFDRVLGPALAEIGDRWHAGKFSVAQEHMATEVIGDTAATMLRLIQPEHADRHAIVACFADETHTVPATGFALHLSAWGFSTTLLGARTPASAVAHAVEATGPDIVALSVTVTPAPHRARELVEDYAKACGDTPWIVGGAAASSLRDILAKQGGVALDDGPSADLKQAILNLT